MFYSHTTAMPTLMGLLKETDHYRQLAEVPLYICRGKKILKCSLVLNFYLSCCQITLGIQGNITPCTVFFYLSVGHCRGKNFLKCSLVLWTSTPKFLLVLLPNNAGHSRKYNLALHFLLVRRTLDENICLSWLKFYLSRAPGQVTFLPLHWMKKYACPDWNFTCPGLQDKWFFSPDMDLNNLPGCIW